MEIVQRQMIRKKRTPPVFQRIHMAWIWQEKYCDILDLGTQDGKKSNRLKSNILDGSHSGGDKTLDVDREEPFLS